ncbi:Methyltransferase [Trichophyton interdigitale]|uniref:Methyltransferase n=1 Tax=Trichophyton interdigitale TaxID=101480 RepID=A0A9P4YMG9_9EURO|nr:Methyltransferase [Trichophyton interdigitale]KAF3900664.1 Methyltransferase [Trichophyton interdigitale]KAG8211421.1 Methyltransferase [Trichophyton interdigitale]
MLFLAAYLHGYPGLTAAEDLPSVKEPENVSDAAASTYETRFAEALRIIGDEVGERSRWICSQWGDTADDVKPFRMLDYACGAGSMTRALLPHVSEAIGIDISQNMVEEYNKNIAALGLPADKMFAKKGNLLSDKPSEGFTEPEYFNFNLVIIGFALHHFKSPDLAMKRLVERLAPGGILVVLDFIEHSLEVEHGVTASGFGPDLRRQFEHAGVGDGFDYVLPDRGVMHGKPPKELRYFLARGERPKSVTTQS